jgi:hypothetical protein
MGHILPRVLTAMLRSLAPMPDSFLESRAGLGVLAHADGVPCFIEDLVVVSRDRRPATSTLRNMRQKGLGQVKQWASARQVAHTADAAVDAPTPPSTGQGWAPREMGHGCCSKSIQNPRVLGLLTGRS